MSDARLTWLRSTWDLLFGAARSTIDDRAIRLSAGVAYYSLFTLIPILFLTVFFASFFLGQDVVTSEIESQIDERLGSEATEAISTVVANVGLDGSDGLASLISLGVLLFASTLLFVAWKEVVGILWGVPRHRGVRASLRRRLFGLAAVLGAGVLLTLVLVVETMVAAFSRTSSGSAVDVLITVSSSFVPALLGVVFIGVLFKYTPDAEITWRSVWLGAAMSMALMILGIRDLPG